MAVAWWDGATFGTLFTLAKDSRFVGEDAVGNKYYESRKGELDGRKRRWVIYNGYADASRVTADWHGWLHHTFDEPPTDKPFKIKTWEKEHQPNLTGTVHAYRPEGSLAEGGQRAKATGDYQAWSPEG